MLEKPRNQKLMGVKIEVYPKKENLPLFVLAAAESG